MFLKLQTPKSMNRKHFIQQIGAAALLASLGVSLESCEKEEVPPDNTSREITFDISTSPFTALANDDGWLIHPSEDILLVNVGGTIHALSAVCTHNGCNNSWSYSAPEFTCGCHGSRFNNNGGVTNGPAQSPLRKFAVSVQGTMVTVTV